ncbi:hypothetical protein [Morganella psychrotolerans]|uniref:hypothetical protein n=1 Tax=Morganella psychrotolerans TaxID=368603 RepID=UPI000943B5E0|nr:hypothetical protein [Morganella psychrotolerans]
MARPPRVHDNTVVYDWLNDNLDMLCSEPLPAYLDDILTGAGRLSESIKANTRPISPYVLLRLLKSLPEITTATVRTSISRLRTVFGENEVSVRYAQTVTACLISASKSLVHYLKLS